MLFTLLKALLMLIGPLGMVVVGFVTVILYAPRKIQDVSGCLGAIVGVILWGELVYLGYRADTDQYLFWSWVAVCGVGWAIFLAACAAYGIACVLASQKE
ncbi:hypothetical protein IPJ70_03675 [Candidatus Campbellbacteria bacterium]|nr:MAG: hypothetical protein IPJ70_03675 [Candidatus Campbellbacteria bacterium]